MGHATRQFAFDPDGVACPVHAFGEGNVALDAVAAERRKLVLHAQRERRAGRRRRCGECDGAQDGRQASQQAAEHAGAAARGQENGSPRKDGSGQGAKVAANLHLDLVIRES